MTRPDGACTLSGVTTERDRDELGRPRSSRPRDALGRPLPPGAQGVPGIPEDLVLSPAETVRCAQDLLDRGLAFNAHEVFEAAWKNGPDTDRSLWQGLAQLAVGITHTQRGNVTGATTLLRRAAGRFAALDSPTTYGLDVAGLISYANAVADELQAGVDVGAERLRPTLTAP